MSTKIYTKKTPEKFTQKEDFSWTKCLREFTKSIHENSPILSTKIHLLCPREVCHPPLGWIGWPATNNGRKFKRLDHVTCLVPCKDSSTPAAIQARKVESVYFSLQIYCGLLAPIGFKKHSSCG